MKLRIIVASCLLAASIGTAGLCVWHLNACARELTAALETALVSVAGGDWAGATRDVSRIWERDREFLHILLPHANLNELEWALGSLPEYYAREDRALYIEQCVRGLQCVNTVREMERVNWGNVF